MKRLLISLMLVVISVAICLISTHDDESVSANAEVSRRTLNVNGVERRFRIVVPHTMGDSPPIVFAFHGTGDTADSMAEYSRLDELAAENKFLLMYPEAQNANWDIRSLQPDSDNADVLFFDSLLEDVSSRYPFDRQRIYLMGMSHGAAFVQSLANQRSSRIAAVMAHSGAQTPSPETLTRRYPILLVVGENDPVADSVRFTVSQYRDAGHPVELLEVPGLGHEWSYRHNEKAWRFLSRHRNRQEHGQPSTVEND